MPQAPAPGRLVPVELSEAQAALRAFQLVFPVEGPDAP